MSRGKVQEHFCTAAHVQYRSVTPAPCTPDQLSPTVAAEPIGLPRCIWWQPWHLSPASWISRCCRGRGAGHADIASCNPQLGWRDGFARVTQAEGSQCRAVHQPSLQCVQDRHYPTWMRGTAHLDVEEHTPPLNHEADSLSEMSTAQTDLASSDCSGPALSSLMRRARASHHWHPSLAPASILLQGNFPQASHTGATNQPAAKALPWQGCCAHLWAGEGKWRVLLPLMRSPKLLPLPFDSPASHMHHEEKQPEIHLDLGFNSYTPRRHFAS